MAMARKTGLGRGLSALLDDIKSPDAAAAQFIGIAQILANPRQPRRHFEPTALEELAQSIAAKGVLQPILVRPIGGGKYELVAGERRWRAAQAAGLHDIPAMVRDLEEGEALQLAIVENVQRADLNAIEEAESYRRLIDEFGQTQETVSRTVGKSRSHVANLLRLLDLPLPVRTAVIDGRLTMGHARAMLGARDPAALADDAIRLGLSVRETEARASRTAGAAASRAPGDGAVRDADLVALERRLSGALGLKVAIATNGAAGRVELKFQSLDQLDMICARLTGGHL